MPAVTYQSPQNSRDSSRNLPDKAIRTLKVVASDRNFYIKNGERSEWQWADEDRASVAQLETGEEIARLSWWPASLPASREAQRAGPDQPPPSRLESRLREQREAKHAMRAANAARWGERGSPTAA